MQQQRSQRPPVPVIDAERLLGGRDEVRIRLGTVEYRLRRTRQGKLILHK